MKKFLTLGFLLLALQEGYGQLGGIKFIPGDYATIAEAIAALNLNGAGPGGVTFNIQAGHQETFSYADAGSITATGNITSRVIFQKAGVGNNPVIVAPTGTGSMDAVIRLIGASYITFDGIDLQENPLNITHPERMEWGYAFLKKSETEGSQNNVIKNCHISLEPSETSGIAIYAGNHTANSLAALLVSSFSGTNSGNLIYGNSCTGTYNGILLSGRADSSFYDQDNQICNNIINGLGNPLSPGSAGSIGINTVNQKDMLITGNTINGTAALASGSCMSIDVLSSTGSLKINQNTISLEYPGTGSFGGIRVTNSNLDSLQVSNNNINNNVIINSTANCPFFWLKSRVIILNFHDNIISENVMPTSSPGSRTCVYTDVSGFSQLQNIHHNSFINNTISGGSNNNFISINGTGQLNFYGNTITNINLGTGTFNIINLSGKNDGNTYDNLISNVTSNGSVYALVNNFTSQTASHSRLYNNTIRSITTQNTSGVIYGIYQAGGTESLYYNNYISQLYSPCSNICPGIYGIYVAGGSLAGFYYNTIYLDAVSSGPGFGVTGIYANNATEVDLRNNILVNSSSPGTSGKVVVFQRNSPDLTTYAAISDNNVLYAGIPGPSHLIFYDGTNQDQTLGSFKSRVAPRDSSSVTELPPFSNISTYPYDLHLIEGQPTFCESGGIQVLSPVAIPSDFDDELRHSEPAYTGLGTAPDIGADEVNSCRLPSPVITGPAVVCEGMSATYRTQPGLLNYSWIITGGTVVGSQGLDSVAVNWITPGTGNVAVTYSDSIGCTPPVPASYQVVVNPAPSPTITGPADVCEGSTDNIYITEPGMISYSWSITGGTITSGSGTSSITVTWNSTGLQTVGVTCINAFGCSPVSP